MTRERRELTAGPRLRRCPWGDSEERILREYHDREWGVPVHDDRKHFEFLTLEGAQAGLSWLTILRKRRGYARAFAGFDPARVVRFTEGRIDRLTREPGIVRNRKKIESAVRNARAFRAVQREFGSFDSYCWRFVGDRPRQNRWHHQSQVPATSPESEAWSADLKRRGFGFVGSTVIYAHMQAVGMVNDHLATCYRFPQVRRLAVGPGRQGPYGP
jgi:DNA-3-methyladenine glycosylase I